MRLASETRSYVVNKLPEEGTSLPKHVEVGTEHEVCFIIQGGPKVSIKYSITLYLLLADPVCFIIS
jgi:hypothetical protein